MPQLDTDAGIGPVDLNNCDREPIHIIGRVQNFGALISVTSNWVINHASENVVDVLGGAAGALIGRPLADVLQEEVIEKIRARLTIIAAIGVIDRLFSLQVTKEGSLCDIAFHRSGENVIIEFERSDPEQSDDLTAYIRPMIDRLDGCDTVAALCDMAVRQIKALTQMNRVKVYRFNSDGSGTVIAEARDADADSFLGLTYPATDIPKQARALFLRNQLRVMYDTSDEGSALVSADGPDEEPLDLTMSVTRAHSPIHVEYLRNMQVGATLTLSIIRNGKLWGLFACHHNSAKLPSYPLRTALELFGLLFSYRLDQVISAQEKIGFLRSQTLHDQIMVQLAEDTSVANNFGAIVAMIADVIPHDGAVGWIDGTYTAVGSTPNEEEFRGLVGFLNTVAPGQIFAAQSLNQSFPDVSDFADRAAGLLVLPVSRKQRDFIVLFRREIAKSIRWAGKPEKEMTHGPFGPRLTPRKSFAAWQETVSGHCAEWTTAQISAAETLRVTLMEVVLRMADVRLRDHARAQEQQELLIAELNHRVHNILNLIKAVMQQSAESHDSVASFTKTLGGRIHALALAHDQITGANWQPASLRQLIATEAAAYLDGKISRLNVAGPDALLFSETYTTVALVLHEMFTNSVKYGALKSEHGSVNIDIAASDDGALVLSWTESGGPAVNAPNRRGFGTTIVERSIPFELGGEAELRFVLTGVEARFVLPPKVIHSIIAVAQSPAADTLPEGETQGAIPTRVLIVEDNIIIGMDVELHLERLGVAETQIVPSVTTALAELKKARFDFALLDINLGTEMVFPVADQLSQMQIPFVFASGYGEARDMPKKFADVPVLTKPYEDADLENVLTRTPD